MPSQVLIALVKILLFDCLSLQHIGKGLPSQLQYIRFEQQLNCYCLQIPLPQLYVGLPVGVDNQKTSCLEIPFVCQGVCKCLNVGLIVVMKCRSGLFKV